MPDMLSDLKAAMEADADTVMESASDYFLAEHGPALVAMLEAESAERAHADMLAEALRECSRFLEDGGPDTEENLRFRRILATHDTRRGK